MKLSDPSSICQGQCVEPTSDVRHQTSDVRHQTLNFLVQAGLSVLYKTTWQGLFMNMMRGLIGSAVRAARVSKRVDDPFIMTNGQAARLLTRAALIASASDQLILFMNNPG